MYSYIYIYIYINIYIYTVKYAYNDTTCVSRSENVVIVEGVGQCYKVK